MGVRSRRSRWLAVVASVALVVVGSAERAAAVDGEVQSDLPFTGLDQPNALTVDDDGNLYIVDRANQRVLELPAAGGPQVTVPFTFVSYPNGIDVDTAGNVYVSNEVSDTVVKLPAGGGPQVTLPFTDLDYPTGVAVNAGGDVFVSSFTDDRVVVLPAGGAPQATVPITGLDGPGDLSVDAAGNLYVADGANDRVVMVPAEGGSEVTLPFVGLDRPTGVTADADGNVYVNDTDNDRVVMLPSGGGAQVTLGFTGLDGPAGNPVVRPDGTVIVADYQHDRVVQLARAGAPLRVTTTPAVPADIVVDGVERDSWGLNWARFPLGPHQVCFGPVPGYVAPPCQDVTLSDGVTTTVEGTYTSRGYLRAITDPPVPSTIVVDGVARNDWGLWTEVAPGDHEVCFGAVAGFDPPSCRTVTASAGTTVTTTGAFVADPSGPGPTGDFGFLRATTSPPSNAVISVDGQARDAWGLNWLKLPTGSHQVCFGPAPNATAPASCQTAAITTGNATVVTGTYLPHGFLRVVTSPAVPATIVVDGQVANAWGVWTSKEPGSHTVCFGAVAGFVAPPCQTGLTVSAGATTTVTGTYVPG